MSWKVSSKYSFYFLSTHALEIGERSNLLRGAWGDILLFCPFVGANVYSHSICRIGTICITNFKALYYLEYLMNTENVIL